MKKVTACFALLLLILIAFPGPTTVAAPSSVVVLGQVISAEMSMDGISVPSGTTLLNETLLQTGSSLAAVHLTSGAVLELGESSSAYFKELPSGEVRVSVETGSLSFREEGEVVTLSADGEVMIPQQTGKPVTAQQQGVVAVLVVDAATGTLTIQVDDVSRIDPSKPILIKSRDGTIQDVRSIASIQGTTITVTGALSNPFAAQDLVIQGDRVEAAAGGAGTAPAAKGLSTRALVAIFGGTGAAAGAILYDTYKGEDEPASPITP